MTHFKAALIVAACFALPTFAVAQIPTGGLTDTLKEKAVDTVIENATTDDALTAGKVLLKGGSKEDAAIAIVKGRAEDKVESIVGEQASGVISGDGISTDSMIAAGKEKLGGVTSGGLGGVASSFGSGTSGAEPEAETLTDRAKGFLPNLTGETKEVAPSESVPAPSVPAIQVANCPAGTTATDFGDCAITGDFKF